MNIKKTIYKGTDERLRLMIGEDDNTPIDLSVEGTTAKALVYVRDMLQVRFALDPPVGSDYQEMDYDAENPSHLLVELQDSITRNWPTGNMRVEVFVERDNTDYSDDRETLRREFRGMDVASSNIQDV